MYLGGELASSPVAGILVIAVAAITGDVAYLTTVVALAVITATPTGLVSAVGAVPGQVACIPAPVTCAVARIRAVLLHMAGLATVVAGTCRTYMNETVQYRSARSNLGSRHQHQTEKL